MKGTALMLVSLCIAALPIWGQTPASAGTGQPVGAATQPASAPALTEAQQYHGKCARAFLDGKWQELAELLRDRGRHAGGMTPEQRQELSYIAREAERCRPNWWKSCRSTSNRSFRATIWNRSFTANYIPSETLGMQAPVDIRRGRIIIVVSWRPNLVDSPRPLEGPLAQKHGFTKGDLGEVIVWHELGHNYVTNFLPLKHVIELYMDHNMLFHHLQEFYADMTALYHCSPKARRLAMMFRLSAIELNRESDCHTRAALAIGAVLLAEFLSQPEKWPSVHFPPTVPEKDAEREGIMYVCANIDKEWTLAEDRQLRELVGDLIRTQGERILRRRGEVPLCSKFKVRLMEPDDRQHQIQRNDWVAGRLKSLIDSGRADKPSKDKKRVSASKLIVMPW